MDTKMLSNYSWNSKMNSSSIWDFLIWIFKPLCYMYEDFSDLKNALFTRLVACQKFQTNPFISTQDFCQKLGWGDALLTERATANPFFLEPEIGLCDKPQWTVFLAKNSGLLQWKQRLKFATMTICSTYIFVSYVTSLMSSTQTMTNSPTKWSFYLIVKKHGYPVTVKKRQTVCLLKMNNYFSKCNNF